MPNENDANKNIVDLAKKTGKPHDEINSLKNIFQKTVKGTKKNLKIIVVVLIILTIALVILVLSPYLFSHTVGYALSSSYDLENIGGEKITTWVYWHVKKDDQFHIHVQDSPEVTKERMQVISDAVLSNKTIIVKNETYYTGWLGALQETPHQNIENIIPFHFHILKTSPESGNVVIKLTNLDNSDGYTGYTRIIVNNSHHQILKSIITIYHVDKLTNPQLALMVRHELGHALGLLHSNNPDDLMYPIIKPNMEYISKCDAYAIVNLYNSTGISNMTC